MVRGLLDLYEASQESSWLEWALRLQDTQDRLFWDTQGGGYFCSEAELGAGLPLRLKDGQWQVQGRPGLSWTPWGCGWSLPMVAEEKPRLGSCGFTACCLLANCVTLGRSQDIPKLQAPNMPHEPNIGSGFQVLCIDEPLGTVAALPEADPNYCPGGAACMVGKICDRQ